MTKTENKWIRMLETKEEARLAILSKGVSIPGDTPFSKYPDKIRQIERSNIIISSSAGETAQIRDELAFGIVSITAIEQVDVLVQDIGFLITPVQVYHGIIPTAFRMDFITVTVIS